MKPSTINVLLRAHAIEAEIAEMGEWRVANVMLRRKTPRLSDLRGLVGSVETLNAALDDSVREALNFPVWMNDAI